MSKFFSYFIPEIYNKKLNSKINKPAPSISIIVSSIYCGGLDILCESLKYQTVQDFELILVDNIYKYRKDIVAKLSSQFNFSIKHITPSKDLFPISNYCNTINTGLINAASNIILIIDDYTYLPPDCIKKHINFHLACPAENIGYIGSCENKILPELQLDIKYPKSNSEINTDADLYYNDLKEGKLNSVLWNVFKNATFNLEQIIAVSNTDRIYPVLTMPFSEIDNKYINGQNISFKLEAALKVNGFDEDLDGGVSYEYNIFTDILKHKLDFTWMVDKDNIVYYFHPTFMPQPRTLRSDTINYKIWQDKLANNFKEPINNYSLQIQRNKIQPQNLPISVIKKSKPAISIILPTNRIGGLDILFESLKNQLFQDFELILVDAIYNARKQIVAEKSKQYNFTVKHIEPINNDFPVSNYCRSMNTGLINADGKIVYFTCDYAHLDKDVLLKHHQFHSNTPQEFMLMMPVDTAEFDHKYVSDVLLQARRYGTKGEDKKFQLMTVPEEVYVTGHNKWSEDYAEDIAAGKLDKLMWSIFKQEICSNGMLVGDIITSVARDNKFDTLSNEVPKPAFHDFVCLKNDSFKLDFVMNANGLDEILDKNHGFQDSLFSRGLKDLYNGQFFAMNTSATTVINTRYFLEPRKVQGYGNNDIINKRYGKSEKITNNVITRWKQNNAL